MEQPKCENMEQTVCLENTVFALKWVSGLQIVIEAPTLYTSFFYFSYSSEVGLCSYVSLM